MKQDDLDYQDEQTVCKSTRSFQSYYIKYLTQKNYKLIFIDSPGYGSYIDNNKWINEIKGYLDNQVS
jgi:septin family protein